MLAKATHSLSSFVFDLMNMNLLPIDSVSTLCKSPLVAFLHLNTQVLTFDAELDLFRRPGTSSLLHDGETDFEGRPLFGGNDNALRDLFSALIKALHFLSLSSLER